MTGDRSGFQPPLTRRPRPVDPRGRWEWPDPEEVAPPSVSQQPARVQGNDTVPLAARWACEPLPPSWPPAPRQDASTDDWDIPLASTGFDPLDDLPDARVATASAQFTPQRPAEGYRSMPGAASQRPAPAAPANVARSLASFGQSTDGSLSIGQDWTLATAIPDEPQRQADPSPSRLNYRLNRLWLTPTVRHFVRVGLPILLTVALLTGVLADADRRAALVAAIGTVRTAIENRPMFQVTDIAVHSRSPEVAQGVAQILGISFPISSFQLDLVSLRETAEALDAVERASLQVRDGVLEVVIEERLPAMIWRNGAGLDLVDANGHRVARLANRAARPDLPLIAGAGAPAAIAEAHLLWAAAAPLRDRVRGLVRVGERRWDVVLDRDQRILLPADGALGALERVMALNAAQDLLARDVRIVDLRNPARPTLRLSPEAAEELTRIRRQSSGARNR